MADDKEQLAEQERPPFTIKVPNYGDGELNRLAVIGVAMQDLDTGARERVVRWLIHKFNITL